MSATFPNLPSHQVPKHIWSATAQTNPQPNTGKDNA